MFEQEIKKLLQKATNLKEIYLEVPPDNSLGDYAFPCFGLAKNMKKNPVEIAIGLKNKIKKTNSIEKIEAKGPYLNFFINKSKLAETIIKKILREKNNYGKGKRKKEKIMIEYSQPNTHKEFHIGHLRNVCLGSSLANILRNQGYKTITSNYINDTGTHVASTLWAYLKFYKNKEPKANKGEWIGKVYVRSCQEIEKNPNYKKEVSTILKHLESNDKDIIQLWKRTKDWSLIDFKKIYKILDARFDIWFYDHELIKPSKDIITRLKEKSILQESQGALIADLEKHNLHKVILLKEDGTIPYITKDLVLAFIKFNKYKIDNSIYVVDTRQSLHFQQLFKILELYGFKQAKKCYHLSYAMVNLPSGTMSSRTGNVVLFMDIYKETLNLAISETKKRHPDWDENKILNTAKKITIAAIKFEMINVDNNKIILFDPKKAISFEGETGPYIQYVHARISSLLRKTKLPKKQILSLLKDDTEITLIKLLEEYPKKISEAASNYKPSILSNYLFELAQQFNSFYSKQPILRAEKEVKSARLCLIIVVKSILNQGLSLLGIEAPERM